MKINSFALATALVLTTWLGQAQPVFISQPQSQSVSLGVDVFLYAPAYGSSPVSYQWQKDGVDLPGEDIEILIFGPVQPSDTGDYVVIACDASGCVTSEVARVTVDASFTKITTGPIVNDIGFARGGYWGDYDNDGYLDLFVVHYYGINNTLYHNNRDGTFTQITTGAIVNDGGNSMGAAWGDINNDGWLDLFVANDEPLPNNNGQTNFVYRNNGDGTFTPLRNHPFAMENGNTVGLACADFDGDGWLDLFSVNRFTGLFNSQYSPHVNYLYHNNRDGTFSALPTAPGNEMTNINNEIFTSASWADYNSDGRPDLLISGCWLVPQYNLLYRNNGNNQFTRVFDSALGAEQGHWVGGAWGDYDNDGRLDLFTGNGFQGNSLRTNALFHNNGDSTFARVTNGAIASFTGYSGGAAWADYDNDGWLDLFVSDTGRNTSGDFFAFTSLGANNALWHNNGDGTFTQVTAGSLVNDGGVSYGCAWGDYDNDGFMDLFVANFDRGNFLYRNSGNSNAWLKVQCRGLLSNRLGVGAKVRVAAVIGGTNRWQLREINGGYTLGSQALLAQFGLGDATNAGTVRVEWPSGWAQELYNVPARQTLTITEQVYSIGPTNPGAALGGEFTFYVNEANGQPVRYQWRFNGADIPDATNVTLHLSNVQSNDLGGYSVAVIDPSGASAVITAPLMLRTAVRPSFTVQPQPTNQSVSVGATVSYKPTVMGTGPLVCQWFKDGLALPEGTNVVLNLTNVQVSTAGRYVLVVTNYGGALTSQVQVLGVDPAFFKLVLGSVVNDGGASYGAACREWGGGAGPSLVVANADLQKSFLYRNLGQGSFDRLGAEAAGRLVADAGYSAGVAVGDYDNDGLADVLLANNNVQINYFYRQVAGGGFERLTNAGLATNLVSSWGAAWADYDRDGWLDLFVGASGNDYLYHNKGDGTFAGLSAMNVVTNGGSTKGCAWADYDNDGWPDLFMANAGLSATNALFHNQRDGTFTKITNGPVATDTGTANGCAWGDYDNDGDLDLFVARMGNDLLYRNNGDGTFTSLTSSTVVTNGGSSYACGWGDYDNDGWLDLFVANNGANFLFHNNGDGSFTRITTGSVVNDGGNSQGCVWADFDGDGFPDLFVSKYNTNNCLYLSNPNTNHWLKVKCVGTQSNRMGIGAKVRVLATIGGRTFWQMREITSGDGLGSQNLIAMFGLGGAASATVLRVEWPSGVVQEWRDVAANQYLSLTEPPRLSAPRLIAGGMVELDLTGGIGLAYTIQTSTNLSQWVPWQTVTNTSRTTTFRPTVPFAAPQVYFRAAGQ